MECAGRMEVRLPIVGSLDFESVPFSRQKVNTSGRWKGRMYYISACNPAYGWCGNLGLLGLDYGVRLGFDLDGYIKPAPLILFSSLLFGVGEV